ncbi:MAG: glycosyltransferase [Lacisediminihabitans sp.]
MRGAGKHERPHRTMFIRTISGAGGSLAQHCDSSRGCRATNLGTVGPRGRLELLESSGRPADSVSALPDRLLWSAYRLSRFTISTSINEGFGLPVAESLASGTPALTSDYGSMKQIASAGEPWW